MAFIRERQPVVLAEAIGQLSTCSRDELPQVVHAVYGTLGSYHLTAAHEEVAALSEVLRGSTSTGADIDAARHRTVTALRSMETSPPT
jgi:hypothetical protein